MSRTTLHRSLALVATLGVVLLAQPAAANLRCNGHLVSPGLTQFEVFERCGPPLFEYSRIEPVVEGVWIDVDEWTYQPGLNQFRRLLRFENGRLARIELLDKPRHFTVH